MQNVINKNKMNGLCNIPTMLTINKTIELTGLSKYYLRNLIADNKIVYLKTGNRFLINFEKLIEFLNGEDNSM